MSQSTTTMITGVTVLTDSGWLENATILIDRGRILDIQTDLPASFLFSREDVDIVALTPDVVMTPGLIDLQLNGAYGVNFGTATIPSIQQVLGQLPRHGVTGILATVVTAPVMDMVTAVNTLEETLHIAKMNQSRLLGVHLEGPVLNPLKCGAHPAEHMLACDSDELPLLLSPHVKLMTLAPEQDPHGILLDLLKQQGIVAFAGHTQANLVQMNQAVEQGLQAVTHLFNAMDGFTHRQPGTALHALNHDQLKATIIADGEHVHPEVVRLAKTVKGTERLILVSDAMALAGTPEGTTCQFAGQSAIHSNGRALNPAGTLAGSVQLLDAAVRNIVQWGVGSLEEAIRMASTNPASLIGLGHECGRIAPGCRADLVLWNRDNLNVMATWIEGQLRWAAPATGNTFRSSESPVLATGIA